MTAHSNPITPGPYRKVDAGGEYQIMSADRSEGIGGFVAGMPIGSSECRKNADFVVEAFTVRKELGLTPRQLAAALDAQRNACGDLIAQRAELLAVLHSIADFAPGNGDVCEIIASRARAVLLKVLP